MILGYDIIDEYSIIQIRNISETRLKTEQIHVQGNT